MSNPHTLIFPPLAGGRGQAGGGGQLILYSDSLQQISPTEASAFGEEPVQLRENGVAEWALSGAPHGWRLRDGGPVQRSRTNPHTGTLTAGNEAGLLTLVLEDETGRERARVGLEIVSTKLSYRTDFRLLLEAIARRATDLLLRQRTDITSPVTPSEQTDPARLTERFFLLRGLLESGEFQQALARILADPHRVLTPETEQQPLSRARRLTPRAVRWLATATPRQPVPAGHRLAERGLTTVPQQLPHTHPTETYDTPENRFVRHALSQLLHALEECCVTERLKREARGLIHRLERALAHPVFAEVGALTQIPVSSKLWERRSGYRELYRTWLAAQQALRLSWDGGQAVFGAGRRDVATLYEYWCFFEVAEAVESVFGVALPYDKLLTPARDGTALTLRRGTELRLETPTLCLTYNPTLTTWTRPVRPDITLELGKTRIHFDAKYRLTSHDDALTDDLLTMHAYRDAIPGTLAAVALYPGTKTRWWPTPNGGGGLGALPLAPGHPQGALEDFLHRIEY
ncbi:DUF2357 domain-containing protein [Armatimonas rosea]|uniref:DUF2357 domain-containing protein n=1 Tax=Armatimonas rosea TaxID=685828 RepID=A0A7W9SPC0_ARMRO|nr:DUF2357 domain-containing protein [Armatimonas rosea]MBB6050301.1 hypothetical protein [Armatimonas rosea]